MNIVKVQTTNQCAQICYISNSKQQTSRDEENNTFYDYVKKNKN